MIAQTNELLAIPRRRCWIPPLRARVLLVATLNTVAVYLDKSRRDDHRYWLSKPTSRARNQSPLPLKERGQRYRIRFVPNNRTRQITRILIHRAPSTTTADCSWAGCACCCPVRLRAAPRACVRMLNPRVFSMTDWYIGSAGR